ncbi:MAG: hypothetical protein QM755_03340 [Luteolibacter sp.]
MSLPPERRRTSPDECSPGDYVRQEDHPDWQGELESVTYQPGHEPGAADPFDGATYKLEVPEDWLFEPRLVTDASGTHRVWARVR